MIPFGQRVKLACRAFLSILRRGWIADDVLAALGLGQTVPAAAPVVVAAPAPAAPLETTDRAVQLLAILQRDGRLIDFLMEDLTPYPDAQIGAAVRDVHSGTRQALERYFTLAPILDDEEGRPITVDRGTDPAHVKVVGAASSPPFRGVLRHRGWEATRVDLPPLPIAGRSVVAPAEVEIS